MAGQDNENGRGRRSQTIAAWVVAGLIGIGLACFFVMTAFALHKALHFASAALIFFTMTVTIGLPVLILGPLIAAPLMTLARAWVWPRPLTDCLIGVAIGVLSLGIGLHFFGHSAVVGAGLLGPIWVDLMCAATSGAIAGGAYWRLAGEPHPPYPARNRDKR